jgi:hypothetical protein
MNISKSSETFPNIGLRSGGMAGAFRTTVLITLVNLFGLTPVQAQQDGSNELLDLVVMLREEVKSLREEVAQLREQVKSTPSPDEGVRPVHRGVGVTAPPAPVPHVPAANRPALSLYGYVKADVFRDSATTSHQEIPFWADAVDGGGELDFTARQTRIGLKVDAPGTFAGGKLGGTVELDFYGFIPTPGNVAGNHAYQLRSRLAYLQWTSPDWEFLAGKTHEAYIIEFPDTVNFTAYNLQGQLGLRRMQLQLTRKLNFGSGRELRTTLAVGEPLGGIHGGDLDLDRIDDGTRSQFPELAMRSVFSAPMGGRRASLGVAGFYARERVWGQTIPAEAIILGGSLPIGPYLTLKGSIWTGSNLDGAWGGIGQGINASTRRGIDASGGWVQLKYQPDSKLWFNLGYSTDDPQDGDLNIGQRSKNTTYLINGYYQVFAPLRVGLEYLQMQTDFLGRESRENERWMSSVIYSF